MEKTILIGSTTFIDNCSDYLSTNIFYVKEIKDLLKVQSKVKSVMKQLIQEDLDIDLCITSKEDYEDKKEEYKRKMKAYMNRLYFTKNAIECFTKSNKITFA